jgi:G:T-mismatch repair DNA endonuclease (very short patch repair protein)/AraC-like DNA-binding protein
MEKPTEELKQILTEKFLTENIITKEIPIIKIASIIGCSSTTIFNYCKKFDINLDKWDRILVKDFLTKELKQKTIQELAQEIKCSISTIKRYIKKHNINEVVYYSDKLDRIITKSFLLNQYNVLKKEPNEIAKIVNCSICTILKKLHYFNIPVRSYKNGQSKEEIENILTKEFLKENLINKGIYYNQIAKMIGCDPETIKKRARKFNLIKEYIPNYEKEIAKILTKSFLIQKYIIEQLPIDKIRQITGCTAFMIKKYLKKYNISIRKEGIGVIIKCLMCNKEKKVFVSVAKNQKFCSCECYYEFKKGKKQSEETIKKKLAAVCASPNKFEQKCQEFLNKLYPNKFKYVGDGSILISGRSPDFINEELKTVVLANGCYYHLSIKNLEITEENKRVIEKYEALPFLSAGYKVLFVWEDEINKLEIPTKYSGLEEISSRVNYAFEGMKEPKK